MSKCIVSTVQKKAPVPGLSDLAAAVAEMAAAAAAGSQVQNQLYMAYADLLCACPEALQHCTQQLLSMMKLPAAHPALSRVLSHTRMLWGRHNGVQSGGGISGTDLSSDREPRTGSEAIAGGRLRARGTSRTTPPAAKRRRLAGPVAALASREGGAGERARQPIRHPDDGMGVVSPQAVSAAAACLQSFDELAFALAPEGPGEWTSEERLLALDAMLCASMPSSPEACDVVWQNVQQWGVWALTRPPEAPCGLREAGLVLGE
jgi:hypothetical protein